MKDDWIAALGKMTYGIYVLTTTYEKTINGMIASWVSMVSYEPPLVMVAVHPNRYSHKLIEQSKHFALNIMSQDQKAYLSRFKGPDPKNKFDGLKWKRGKTGCPLLPDCIGYLECKIEKRYEPGNHSLFIGKIIHAEAFTGDLPLSTLDYEGVYLGKN